MRPRQPEWAGDGLGFSPGVHNRSGCQPSLVNGLNPDFQPSRGYSAGVAVLTRHGSDVGSVFDLLGDNENDLTSALGFVLARSPLFREAIMR